MMTSNMGRSLLTLALAGALLIVQPTTGSAADTLFQGQHRGLSFTFVHQGEVVSQRSWPEVTAPSKFTMEIVLQQAGAELFLMVFDLNNRSGEWWLSEVMGFLFDPELEITSSLTAQGYETYEIRIPGGQGVYAQTEILLLAPGEAYRFTCYRCDDATTMDALQELVDSFSITSPLSLRGVSQEATP